MYSVVLMVAATSGGDMTGFGHKGSGCTGYTTSSATGCTGHTTGCTGGGFLGMRDGGGLFGKHKSTGCTGHTTGCTGTVYTAPVAPVYPTGCTGTTYSGGCTGHATGCTGGGFLGMRSGGGLFGKHKSTGCTGGGCYGR